MKNKPLDRSSGMFTSSTHSSGDLCGGVIRCVVWWRFRQAKDGTTPEEEPVGTARTRSSSKSFCSGDLCGSGEGLAWRKQRWMAWRKQRLWVWTSFFCFLKSFRFFKWWVWRGKHLLAGVKPVFYTIAWMFSLNKITNYCCLVVLLICLSFINYNLLYYYFINYKIINCCLVKHNNII